MRLYHTLRYLKPRQIVCQVHNRVRSRLENPSRFLTQPVPEFSGCRWPKDTKILPPGMQVNTASEILNGKLTFLNNRQDIGWMPDWQCGSLPKLWQYNLHYFEWLWALEYEDAKAAVLDWVDCHGLAKGRVAWEPYPISLRVMNLCGVFFAKYRAQIEEDACFLERVWKSIYRQCQWLIGHLEVHLLGNHYFENAAALAFVGSCFEGEVAQQWLDAGIEILQSEIPEQILSDGMHFELSPMYHSRMLYLLTILLATGNEQVIRLVKEPLERMIRALNSLCHPDGQIALLNDSAFGVYNEPDELRSFCRESLDMAPYESLLTEGCFVLPDAGYYGWHDENGNYIVCDYGRIGPDYIPGHAHADMFCFELSLKGHRVIVDAGVCDYEASDTRRYCRSTAAHNTVEIDGQDQCEMWSAFRVARRGYPQDVKWQPATGGFSLSGWHNGYQRLSGRPVHIREIDWDAGAGLTVTDRVSASRSVKATSRAHLHPECKVLSAAAGKIDIEHPKGCFCIEWAEDCEFHIEEGWYYPKFGVKQSNPVIALTKSGCDIELRYTVKSALSSKS
ncbi:heparinase II/III family protein [Planctomycetota bacterium]